MSELYKRLSLADRKERAKRQRELDRQSREEQAVARAELVERFRDRTAVDPSLCCDSPWHCGFYPCEDAK